MRDPFEQPHQYVEALLAGRKPRRFRVAEAEDWDALKLAAQLAAAGAADREEPTPQFVAGLTRQMEARARGGRDMAQGRRGLLAAALAGLAAGIGSGLGLDRWLLRPSSPPQPAPAPIPIVRDNGRWYLVARLSELPPNTVIRFTAGALEGHLIKRGQEVTALSAICSHLPCSLVWQEGEEHFLCPCHDATFHPSGELKFARRPYAPLTRFEITVDGDRVLVWSIGSDTPRQPASPL
ncbi:MAG: Rieske (2Fe-2S) protein [Chloroflexi bacterium]|nr:Rieske (2Fe-2S) protein [Chloroflexota bacterium]